MHASLTAIHGKLTQLIVQLKAVMPSDEPVAIAHGNWSFPGITRTELIEEAQSIITSIDERGSDDIGATDAHLNDYVRRLEFLRTQTLGQIWGGNGGLAVQAYMLTLDGLRKALAPALKKEQDAEALTKLRKAMTRLRGMEARLNELEPRTSTVATMVERIESAYNAADQLPADLESLAEAREKIGGFSRESEKDHTHILALREKADRLDKGLEASAAEAKTVLAQCEWAYSAATSVGLAAAFSERSTQLARSMWAWVIGLVIALGTGALFGSQRLHELSDVFKNPNVNPSAIILNLLLSLLSVGAPVWFAWLATKQIGQRFRLAEDYGYKASISRAYEGFRRETARFDKDMESRLLVSALTRLDELPLRLVETETHGSPWHELASSSTVKDAMKLVPGFADRVKALASQAINTLTTQKDKGTVITNAP